MTNEAISLAVILAMAATTYVCRSFGYFLMGYVPLTPRVRRGLEALPGAVVVSIVVPGAVAAGPAGIAGVIAGMVVMAVTRHDILGLLVGCAVAVGVRSAGL
ncbi:AzlD family protein [Candidatus Raskinella chloraquaticus]